MAKEKAAADAGTIQPARPVVRKIGTADLKEALSLGFADFKAMPTHLVFLFIIYPIVMVIVARSFAGYEVLPAVFPLLAGYTLIGPLGAVATYEMSRRREQGLESSRRLAFEFFRLPSMPSVAALGALLMAVYFVWLGAALALYIFNFGWVTPASIPDFARQIFTTSSGWTLIVVGSGVGFIAAVIVFTLSVVSFPLLLDKNVGVVQAVQTSIRAVLANPVTMGIWGIVVAFLLLLGSLPFFVGLAVVLPTLGHATWHLYRRVVE